MIDALIKLFVFVIDAVFGLLGEILSTIFDGFGKRKHVLTAQFMSERELLSRHSTGFCLSGIRSISNKASYVNALCMGGTGTGKSSVVLIPSLYSMRGSFVIHDPSGELHTICSGHLLSRGYDVKVINFSRPEISMSCNPIENTNTSSEILKVATPLINDNLSKGKSDPFWVNSGISLLSTLIAILKTQPKEFQNLYNVRHLILQMGSNPKQVDALFEEFGSESLKSEYAAFIASDDKVVSGVLATCRAALNLFADENIAQVTASGSIDMESFRKRPTAIFIQNGTADAKYFAPLTSIIFEQLFAALLKKLPEKNDLDVFLLIDEAATLNLPTLPQFVANSRKYRAGSLIMLQSFRQLVHNYGVQNAETIRANCYTKMYFGGQPLETCKELEETLGKFEFQDKQKKTVLRPLMTADEIRMLPTDRALIIYGNKPPIKARLRPYYKRRDFLAYSKLPAAPYADCATTPLITLPLPHVEEE